MLCQCAVLEAYVQYPETHHDTTLRTADAGGFAVFSPLQAGRRPDSSIMSGCQANQLDSHRLKIYTVKAINFPTKNAI